MMLICNIRKILKKQKNRDPYFSIYESIGLTYFFIIILYVSTIYFTSYNDLNKKIPKFIKTHPIINSLIPIVIIPMFCFLFNKYINKTFKNATKFNPYYETNFNNRIAKECNLKSYNKLSSIINKINSIYMNQFDWIINENEYFNLCNLILSPNYFEIKKYKKNSNIKDNDKVETKCTNISTTELMILFLDTYYNKNYLNEKECIQLLFLDKIHSNYNIFYFELKKYIIMSFLITSIIILTCSIIIFFYNTIIIFIPIILIFFIGLHFVFLCKSFFF